jgi:CubicO group peptidase (beta-lactamase class C family)/D-alanyl-D-alanine dipeptidase
MRSWIVLLLIHPSILLAQPDISPAKAYRPSVEIIEPYILEQVKSKNLPALSIAWVVDQEIVWATGFGHEDLKKTKKASAETIYRVGSVSKLFTDIAVMQLVEKGQVDLDAPITKYVRNFKAKNTFHEQPMTLRQLMTHRSGLIREPPVGNYFDPTFPTLQATVDSMNGIDLVYPPEKRIKYSNGAIALVGYTVELLLKQPFVDAVRAQVLAPLRMQQSAFEPTIEVKKHLAEALMWNYHGKDFPAPTFELGMIPAGSLYSNVLDMSKFLKCLFQDGKGILKPESLQEMYRPQFAKEGTKSGFGLGFMIGELEGKKRIGHGGAVYGFATELAALPEEKLGVIVIGSRDVANSVVEKIANESLKQLLAVKQNAALPKIIQPTPITKAEALKWAGLYRSGSRTLELTESAGRLSILPDRGGYKMQIQKMKQDFISDDVLDVGTRIEIQQDKLVLGKLTYEKVEDPLPPDAPDKWKGLIGEYGWDHNTLYILEHRGKLVANIEWFFFYPLTEISDDVYAFPDFGLYHGEKIIFNRDKNGRATQAEAAKVVFKRRKLDGENGETFRVKATKPIEDLRKDALASMPPLEQGKKTKVELVDLSTLDPTIKFDIRYATTNNFLSTPFYTTAKAYLQRPAAESVLQVHQQLKPLGYGLIIFDAYRPWFVTKMFWDGTPEKFHDFVADPRRGSRHNRGCAVDLGIYDLKTGKVIEMVAGYDEFSDRSYPDYLGGTTRQRWHRDLLRRMMEANRFTVVKEEWWHFDYLGWQDYPISNVRFEEIGK